MEDEQIIELLFARSEEALKNLSEKYGRILMNISMNILNNQQDAEECLNDSYLGIWNVIPPQKPASLLAFLCKITRNLSIKKYEKNTAEKRKSNYGICIDELSECLPSGNTVEHEVQSSELSKEIDSFIQMLEKTDRLLFIRRYWFMDSYPVLSEISHLKEPAVRTRLSRIRKRLKDYLQERGLLS